MKIRKKFLFLVLISLIAIFFGCSSSSSDDQEKETTNTSSTSSTPGVTVTINDDSSNDTTTTTTEGTTTTTTTTTTEETTTTEGTTTTTTEGTTTTTTEGTTTTTDVPVEIAGDGLANLTISVTDAPIDDAESVKVTFNRITVKEGACGTESDSCDEIEDASGDACGYVDYFVASADEPEKTIDLLQFQNGESFFFDTKALGIGEYCQVRVYLADGEDKNTIKLAADGETKALREMEKNN